MPDSGENEARTLKALRDRIDDTDARMHGLLIERGAVIEELIRIKGTSRPGAAFRPMREADMMRRLVARHSGHLPLVTIEHIWREIITTFTLHAERRSTSPSIRRSKPDRMRDLARFVFGFSVDLVPLDGAGAVIDNVAATGNLGLVARKAKGAWWLGLAGGKARIIALVPFIESPERPATLPAFVVSPPLTDETAADVAAYAVTVKAPFRHAGDVEIAGDGDGRGDDPGAGGGGGQACRSPAAG